MNQQSSATVSAQPHEPSGATAAISQPARKKVSVRMRIALLVVALIFGCLGIIFASSYEQLQVRSTASAYMTAIEKGDTTAITRLSSGTTSTALAQKTTADLKGANYTITGVHNTSGTGYRVSFEIKNSPTIKETTLTIQRGKVVSFSVTPNISLDTPKTTVTDACLTKDIVTKASVGGYASEPYSASGYQMGVVAFFESDSTNYQEGIGVAGSSDVVKLAEWTKIYQDRKFHLEITAKVQEGKLSDAGAQLATDRAEKIKKIFTDAGVLESKIKIMPHQAERGTTDFERSTWRNVNVSLIGDC